MPSEAERTISGTITSGSSYLSSFPAPLRFETFFIDILVYSLRNDPLRKLLDSLSFSLSWLLSGRRGDSLPLVASRHLAMGGTCSSSCVCDPGNIPPWLMVMFKILLRRETGAAGRINDDSSSSLTAVAFSMNDRRRGSVKKRNLLLYRSCRGTIDRGRSIARSVAQPQPRCLSRDPSFLERIRDRSLIIVKREEEGRSY